jgi:hypothetical protein
MAMKARFSVLTLTAALALTACAHTPPTPTPVAPPAKHVDKSIGTATMLSDGTIVLELRTSMDTDGSGKMIQKIKPTDMQYASTLKQIGGLKPGQSKSIDEYPVQ